MGLQSGLGLGHRLVLQGLASITRNRDDVRRFMMWLKATFDVSASRIGGPGGAMVVAGSAKACGVA